MIEKDLDLLHPRRLAIHPRKHISYCSYNTTSCGRRRDNIPEAASGGSSRVWGATESMRIQAEMSCMNIVGFHAGRCSSSVDVVMPVPTV